MPRLPNFLIHLSAFIRPQLLRPDIRVPHIGYVDFKALKKEGFNAVVVDKDNCITTPEHDKIYEPFKSAWEDLLQTFPPGRVLIVSNSAGTPKDPSGIAAESVSLNLKAPVLIRKTPKPGCSPEIISYFRGALGRPTTLRGRLHDQIKHIQDIEKSDEKELLQKWIKEVEEGPLFGPVVRSSQGLKGGNDKGSLENRMVAEQVSTKPSSPSPPSTPAPDPTPETASVSSSRQDTPAVQEDLRILVVGDRLFTDTLLAHRLSRHLGSSTSPDPKVLSIHTTLLPQPNDVKFLRWLETKLSRGRIRSGKVDWGRYVRDPYDGVPRLSDIEAEPSLTWKEKWQDFKGDVRESRLRWDPRTWTLFDLAVGAGRGVVWFERGLVRVIRRSWELAVKQIRSIREKRQSLAPLPSPPSTTAVLETPTKITASSPVDSVNA